MRVLHYFVDFLKPEMHHVYRQVGGLRGWEAWVACKRRVHEDRFPFERIELLKRDPLRGIKRLVIKRGPRIDAYTARELIRLRPRLGCDLVHIYFGHEAAKLLPWLERETAPIIVSFHGMDTSDLLAQADLERLQAIAKLFLARSESLVQALVDRGVPRAMIRLNPTGIPLPTDIAPRRRPDISADRPLRLLQACRFAKTKGLDVSIRATAILNERGAPTTLTLAGYGDLADTLRALAASLGIVDRVAFPGMLPSAQLSSMMRDHDVFVHPSRTTETHDREGIPNSILEAMAHGLPVVATRHSGIPEAITDPDTGLLIDPADAQADPTTAATALANALTRLLEGDTYPRISAATPPHIAQTFSLDTCIAKLEAAYALAVGTDR